MLRIHIRAKDTFVFVWRFFVDVIRRRERWGSFLHVVLKFPVFPLGGYLVEFDELCADLKTNNPYHFVVCNFEFAKPARHAHSRIHD